MANWEKLNKEFDDCLDSMTKEDWDNWYKNVEQKRINQNKMNTEKQLTAVEWLYDQIKNGFNYNRLEVNGYENQRDRLFEQAQAMVEDEAHKAYLYGHEVGFMKAKEHELNKSE